MFPMQRAQRQTQVGVSLVWKSAMNEFWRARLLPSRSGATFGTVRREPRPPTVTPEVFHSFNGQGEPTVVAKRPAVVLDIHRGEREDENDIRRNLSCDA